MAFLKFIFIGALVVWLLKEVFRLIVPRIINNYINKIQDEEKGQKPKKEGETTVISGNEKQKENLDNLGEYTDFEEIDE